MEFELTVYFKDEMLVILQTVVKKCELRVNFELTAFELNLTLNIIRNVAILLSLRAIKQSNNYLQL